VSFFLVLIPDVLFSFFPLLILVFDSRSVFIGFFRPPGSGRRGVNPIWPDIDCFRVKATVQFSDEKVSSEEMLRTLNDPTFVRKPEMIRALVPACVSLQIPVKMGMKLVAQTAALFWSVDHVFCNFEVGTIPPSPVSSAPPTPQIIYLQLFSHF
jgi:hypothetical protein